MPLQEETMPSPREGGGELDFSLALTRRKGGYGCWDLGLRMELLMRFLDMKSGVPMKASQVLETHLNRSRDLGGRCESIFTTTSSGR